MVFTIGTLTLNSPNTLSLSPSFRHRYGFLQTAHVPLLSNNAFSLQHKFVHFSRIPIKASNNSHQVNNDDGLSKDELGLAESFELSRNLLKFGSDNFLPLALVGGVIFGLVNPTLGCVADRYYLSRVGTFGIFLISGLTLHSDEVGAGAQAWPVGLFGLIGHGKQDEELRHGRLSVVVMAGLAAEGLKFDKVVGQSADLFTLQRLINRSKSPLSKVQQQNITRLGSFIFWITPEKDLRSKKARNDNEILKHSIKE